MFKNINWNVTVPVVVGAFVAGMVMWYLTKPEGLLSKFDGDDDTDQ